MTRRPRSLNLSPSGQMHRARAADDPPNRSTPLAWFLPHLRRNSYVWNFFCFPSPHVRCVRRLRAARRPAHGRERLKGFAISRSPGGGVADPTAVEEPTGDQCWHRHAPRTLLRRGAIGQPYPRGPSAQAIRQAQSVRRGCRGLRAGSRRFESGGSMLGRKPTLRGSASPSSSGCDLLAAATRRATRAGRYCRSTEQASLALRVYRHRAFGVGRRGDRRKREGERRAKTTARRTPVHIILHGGCGEIVHADPTCPAPLDEDRFDQRKPKTTPPPPPPPPLTAPPPPPRRVLRGRLSPTHCQERAVGVAVRFYRLWRKRALVPYGQTGRGRATDAVPGAGASNAATLCCAAV